jgi:hypothetical protein
MAGCSRCGAETELYNGGVPLCVKCSRLCEAKRKPPTPTKDIRAILFQDLLGATARNNEALREFDEVSGQFPSGLPHPDGVQRIKNASNALSVARKEMATAHNRLSDYLDRGIIPDDLKRSG